jgi:hypothetical protein
VGEGEGPVVSVCDAVVASAEQHEVGQDGLAAVLPGVDVVGVAVAWWSVASGVGAAAVAGVEGSSESWSGHSVVVSGIGGEPEVVEHGGGDAGVAEQQGGVA